MTDQIVFSGNLRFISLTNVFKLIGENSCTGILSLRSDYTEFIGLIYFVNGNAINGSFGDLKGLKAVYSMFGWTEGNYEFCERELSHINPVIKQSSQEIIIQAFKMLTGGEIKRIGPLKPEQVATKIEETENEYFILIDEPSEQTPDTIHDNPREDEKPKANAITHDQLELNNEMAGQEFNLMDVPLESTLDTVPDDSTDSEVTMADAVAPDQVAVKDEMVEHELFHMINEPLEHAGDMTPDDPTDAEMTMADAVAAAQMEVNEEEIEKEFSNLFGVPLENISDMVTDDSAGAEPATAVPTDLIKMEMTDAETENEFLNPAIEPLKPISSSSTLESMDAEITKAVPIMSNELEMKNNEAKNESFDLNLEDSLFGNNTSSNCPAISDDPIDSEKTKNGLVLSDYTEINDVETKSGSFNPIEEPSEHICSRCGTPLGVDGVEESLFDHNVCFRCDMISDVSMDAEPSTADPLAPKVKKLKTEEAKKKIPIPVKEPLKPVSAAIPSNYMGTEIRKTSPSAPKLNKMKNEEVKKKPPVPVKKSLEPVSARIPDDSMGAAPMVGKPMDENGFNLISMLKSKLQSWGPFHYFVTISIVLAWVVVGIIYFGDSKPSSPKPELAIPEKNTPKTETSSQVKPAPPAVTQAPVASNTGSLQTQETTSGHVKTIQATENKPSPVVNNTASLKTQEVASAHVATPQEKEIKSTPAPVEKIEQPPKQIIAQQATPVEKDNTPKTTQVVEPQAPAVENEVKKIPDSAKSAIENKEPAEKIEVAKQTPPAKEATEKEPAAKPAIITKDPEFPGGKAALAKWLSSHITIPTSVTRSGVEGNVIVELTIDSQEGKISNVAIVKSLQKQCDQEVVRVVSNMPNWKPGEVNGVKTNSKYNLSVRFSAQ
jgi:periplasmic protein TonB